MLELKPVAFSYIQHWFVDFQKKSKNYDIPSDTTETLGIFEDNKLVGYFIIQGYQDRDLEIQQGYLNKAARHKNLSPLAMGLLEQKAKKVGYKRIILASSRTLKAYTNFMSNMGYKPERIIFSKQVG